MTRPFRFAVQSPRLREPDAVSAAARQAESLGYEEFYSFDHIGAVDPFAPLVVAACATTTLRVGPLVLNNELHHPALLARTAASVDRLTGGRLVLGMGTGYAQDEHDSIGVELRRPADRVSRFGECLGALRSLLDSGGCTLDGQFHRLAVTDLGIRPAQEHVPFLIGGHGRRVVGLAAKYADIFQFTGLTHAADGTPQPGGFGIEQVVERARWLTEAAGDRDAAIERSVLAQVTHLGDGADAALGDLTGRFGLDRTVLDEAPFVLAGSVEQVVDKLERLRERLGVSHAVVRDPEGFAPVVAALAGR